MDFLEPLPIVVSPTASQINFPSPSVSFIVNDTLLKKYTIPQLKQIAHKNELHVSGTKPILISRICTHYEKYSCAAKIQKVIRGWFVRTWIRERPATQSPINDADFYSFERVDEIPYRFYFSYTAKCGATYGFRIQSFLTLVYKGIINNGNINILNPYNREPIPPSVILSAFRFVRLYNIIFWSGGDALLEDGCENMHEIIYSSGTPDISRIQQIVLKQNITRKLEEIRKKTAEQRIINLFMDIDLLGNYTSHTWFSDLTARNALVFWGALYDIWLYRAGILPETKKLICPIHDPFHKKLMKNTKSVEEVLENCLYAMENLVYMSPEEEYRKLGAMYVLCALTVVSGEARRALPWLADVVAW